jgi:hypothetical protein
MTDKELFERHCEQISVFNNRNEECTCALLTETQFLSALKERDEERVCEKCTASEVCSIYVKAKDCFIDEPFSCNQWKAKHE